MPTEDDGSSGEPLYWARLRSDDTDDPVEVNVRDTHSLELDEPPWSAIGEDRAPCPIDYLITGVAGCQLEVLTHCLERSHVEEYTIDVDVEATLDTPGDPDVGIPDPETNRIASVDIELAVDTTQEYEDRVDRCLDIAERVCIVTRSVRGGIDVPISCSVTLRED